MSPRPEIRALIADLDAHVSRVEAEVRSVERLSHDIDESDQDRLRLIAAYLHAFYTGVEVVLTRSLERFEGPPPDAADSHRRMLAASQLDIPGVRPPVVSSDTARLLQPYLAFRHFFRHAYGVALDWDRMSNKVAGLPRAFAALTRDLGVFRAFLERLADA